MSKKIIEIIDSYNYGVLLSAEEYKCNLAVCRAEDSWYIVINMDSKKVAREYKKRFIIEEMFVNVEILI